MNVTSLAAAVVSAGWSVLTVGMGVAGAEPATYVQPNSVGYRGSIASLTVVDSTHPLSGCTWNSNDGTVCPQANLTLDHVYVKGGLMWQGNGTITITNSIIEGGGAQPHTFHSSDSGSPTIHIADSTLRWPDGQAFPTDSDNGLVISDGTGAFQLYRNNLYGQPHGIEVVGDNSVIDSNWIHDLAYTASDPHLDGIYVMSGKDITITHNYVDATANSIHATAAIFFSDWISGKADLANTIVKNNFFSGGAYSFYDAGTINADVENNIIEFGVYGDAYLAQSATIATWINNTRLNGTVISKPVAH
jgi:Right handed beta helix region